MRNLYCYSDKIIYQTSNESDFPLFEQQAQIEGLEIIESEFFPFEISTDGKLLFDSDNNPIPISIETKLKLGILDLEIERKRILNLINFNFEKSFEEIKIQYPQSEREGWGFLVFESESFLKEKNFEKIPSLHAENNFVMDEIIITESAKKVLKNSTEYKKFLGQMKFLKSQRIEKLQLCDTPEKIFALEKEING
ncbi:MAG: hypothetical protein IPL26_30075 [Leptospiraceae bacterium]|nr:hypothetical protein [Leptospiraceae bacterium]